MSAAENDTLNHASRRDVLKAAAALTVAFWLPRGAGATPQGAEGAAGSALEPNAFVRIGADDTVTVLAKHLEMGQGVYTGLATIVAEELDADWKNIRVEGAPADAKRYNNLAFGPMQGTGGSSSISNSYDQLRKAGATARALLVTAAAQRWKVPAADVTVTSGIVEHKPSGKRARFGELVADAAKLPVPADVKLKDPATFKLIGKDAARVDSRDKSNGTAIVHPGHPPSRHAHGSSHPRAVVRRQAEELRCDQGEGDQGREVRGCVRDNRCARVWRCSPRISGPRRRPRSW